MTSGASEPSPRWGHFSSPSQGMLYMYGGLTIDFYQKKDELASMAHSYDPYLETWQDFTTSGTHPPGLYNGSCASVGHNLYLFGGYDGAHHQNSLYQLDTRALEWTRLASGGPMPKVGCEMIAYDNKLMVFGGYGTPYGSIQEGSEFLSDSRHVEGRGWTNELHLFDINEGMAKARLL